MNGEGNITTSNRKWSPPTYSLVPPPPGGGGYRYCEYYYVCILMPILFIYRNIALIKSDLWPGGIEVIVATSHTLSSRLLSNDLQYL